jgi:hypothetical protein
MGERKLKTLETFSMTCSSRSSTLLIVKQSH